MIDLKHTKEELKEMQAWPLERKISVTQTRIMEWYLRHEGKAYISFSGGKDSTVLIDIARRMYPDIEAVFVDTGLEYPEIRDFVKTFDNVTWLHPIKYDKQKREWVKTNFRDVILTYGYPIISKEVSEAMSAARNKPHGNTARKFDSNSEYCKKYGIKYDLSKWNFLLESNIPVSKKCCDTMKKNPVKQYEKKKGLYPILGTMACESALRKDAWLKYGCNSFEAKRPISQPMSFWTEQDVLKYLKKYDIPYCSVYGDIVEEKGKLKTTQVSRTGCMFCGFGCHLEKEPNKFQMMKTTHPKQYDYCIRPTEEGGLGMGRVLDFIGVKY